MSLFNKFFLLLILCFSIVGAKAQNQQIPLSDALKQFAHEHDLFIAFDEAKVATFKVNRAEPQESVQEVLLRWLADTPLVFEQLEPRSYMIINRPAEAEVVDIPVPKVKKHAVYGAIVGIENFKLPFAVIRIKGTDKGVTSGQDGQFHIHAQLSDTLVFTYVGYEPMNIAVQDLAAKNPNVVNMDLNVRQLDAILISSMQKNPAIIPQAAGRYSQRISPISATATGKHNAFYALQFLPGVNSNGLSSNLQVRGGSTGQTKITIDRQQVFLPDHYYGIFNVINPVATQDIILHKGTYDVSHGQSVAGILEIQTKNDYFSHQQIGLSAHLFGVNMDVALPIIKDKWYVFGAFRQSHDAFTNWYINRFANDQPETIEMPKKGTVFNQQVNPEIQFGDLYLKSALRISDRALLELSGLKTWDRYDHQLNLRSKRNRPIQDRPFWTIRQVENRSWANESAGMDYTHWLGEQQQLEVFANVSVGENQVFKDRNFNDGNTIKVAEQHDQQLKTVFGGLKLQHHAFTVGFDLTQYQLEISNKDTIHDQTVKLANTYLAYQKKWEKVSLTAGGNFLYYQPDGWLFSPRVQLNTTKQEGTNFKLGLGRYYQFLHQITDPLSSLFRWRLTTPEQLPSMVSDQISIGLQHSRSHFSFDAEYYAKNNKNDLSVLALRTDLAMRYFLADGLSQGLDTYFNFRHEPWNFYMAYAYNHYHLNFQRSPEEIRKSHILQTALVYTKGNWQLGCTWIGKSIRYDFENFNVEEEVAKREALYNMPFYHRMDLSVAYHLNLGSNQQLEFALNIYDLYHQKNIQERTVDQLPVSAIFNQEFLMTDVTQMGFFPNVSVSWRYSK